MLSVGRPRDRPAELAGHVHVLVHIGRPTPGPVDRPIDRQSSLAGILGIENLSL